MKEKKDIYVYEIGDSLYINFTNRCTNRCSFCVRNNNNGVGGFDLWLNKEPTAEEIIAEAEKYEGYKKMVMCGFGEPMIKIDELVKVASHFKKKGFYIRINTNGQANAYHGRDVTQDIVGIVDKVSVSMNAPTAEEYQEICKSIYGEAAFDIMLDFAKKCIEKGIDVTLSVVDVIGEENIRKCEAIAKGVGAKFRVRTYIK